MTARDTRILVTAAAGDLGQAVVKCLRLGCRDYEIQGGDMAAGSAADLFVETRHVLPAGRQPDYVDRLNALCRDCRIDAVIPCSEAEIAALCRCPSHPLLPGGTRIISQSPRINATYGDKLTCMRHLEGRVALAAFADGSDRTIAERFISEHGFPVCIKERRSSGSRGVAILHDAESFARELPRFHSPLLQAFIDGADREYSVGVFSGADEIRLISFRRRLERLGCSWYAELDQPGAVLDYCRQIAESVDTRGSYNIQLRLGAQGPLLLEINPRFSSLAAARAACGFNDVEWSLLQTLEAQVPPARPLPAAFRYQRYIAEAIDFGDGFHVPRAWSPRMI